MNGRGQAVSPLQRSKRKLSRQIAWTSKRQLLSGWNPHPTPAVTGVEKSAASIQKEADSGGAQSALPRPRLCACPSCHLLSAGKSRFPPRLLSQRTAPADCSRHCALLLWASGFRGITLVWSPLSNGIKCSDSFLHVLCTSRVTPKPLWSRNYSYPVSFAVIRCGRVGNVADP